MAQQIAHQATRAADALTEDFSAGVYTTIRNAQALGERFAAWRAYRRTIAELSGLGGDELADLGLHRSEIRRVAHEAVYGKLR